MTHLRTAKTLCSLVMLCVLAASLALRGTTDSAIALAADATVVPGEALSATKCNDQMRSRLEQQVRLERQVWFGRQKAEDMPLNSTRYDEGGTAWLKTEKNIWRTAVAASANTVWTDADMNKNTEWEGMNDAHPDGTRDERLGIFQQKEMLTSELVPQLAQSERAFRYRLEMVCDAVQKSYQHAAPNAQGLLTIRTAGSDTLMTPALEQCAFGNGNKEQNANQINLVTGMDEQVVDTECAPLAAQLAQREAAFLRIAVAYDAATRSTYQLGGNIDSFLRGLRGDFLAPLEQTLPLLSAFSRIPCFTTQCNL